ncbi:hypothetical protein OsI_13406 [Oryza sativa Indica Group]|uniref:BED-type domain-containing protein n=1 Tax=Oryza sativa subsp. indica TaxID=39946 RepID=A2XLQ3_ORYSI|nr:hypothetical protein OsI_13406 [Oryza sativa Indica Group]
MTEETGNDFQMVQGYEIVPSNEEAHAEEVQGDELVLAEDLAQGDEVQVNRLVSAEMSTPPTSRRRRKKSLVWEHFTIEAVSGGATRACCKLCKQTFAYSSGSKIAGTSHLKRHITLGSCPKIKNQEHKLALTPAVGTDNDGEGTVERPSKRRYRYTGYANAAFDQDRSCSYLAKMIILHDYPLHIVQQPAFTTFIDSLQPRFRVVDVETMEGEMKLVEFSYSKIYGVEAAKYVKVVDDAVHELYKEYVAQPLPLTPAYVEQGDGNNAPASENGTQATAPSTGDGLVDFDMYLSEIATSQPTKSELEQYLDESLTPRIQEFDILNWWKLNTLKFPTLSRMARDILAIPMSMVSSGNSIFSAGTGTRMLDDYRSSLRPEIVEALVCAKDWLQYLPATPEAPSTTLVKVDAP